ncbi:MAG: NUDIX hydrolase [Lachnospiraceae bacterium]|nr:NUDIX hydrolase [Lachnospiraceae bacterium]
MALPNGNTAVWDFIEHKGAAAVVPVTGEGKILMVRQYRNALERYTLEIPAGAVDYVEEPKELCAARELEEETGYRAGRLEWLMNVNTTVAFCNEFIGIYVAEELIPARQHLDEDEFLNVEEHELEELLSMVYEGKITDAKTAAALLAYRVKYR